MTYLPAKKSLGQNFLNSPGIAKKIVDISEVSSDDIVLEIGPGKGMLTEILLAKVANAGEQKMAGKVIAIEKDKVLSHELDRFQTPDQRLSTLCADFLKADLLNLTTFLELAQCAIDCSAVLFQQLLGAV